MVAINKFVLLAVVASVLVSAAYAADESAPVESVGNIRSFGRKIVDGGSSILSHIPIVNRFFGNSDKTPAAPATDDKPVPDEKPTEEQPAEEQATEEKPATEEPAVEEQAQTEAPAAEESTPAEAPAKEEEEAKSEEPAQSQ